MRPIKAFLAFVLLTIAAGGGAQTPLPAPKADPSYLIGPEDLLMVTTRDHLEATGEFLVRADGKITFPYVGEIKVEGQTVQQIRELLAKELSKEYVNPDVTVNVKTMRINRVYILGSVNTAGMLDWKPGWRLTELISAAGGLNGLPERLTALIWRKGETAKRVPLKEIFIEGKEASNVEVRAGDTVNIHDKPTIRVTVTGKVVKQGLIDVFSGDGASEAVAAAGGSLADGALSRAKVVRKGKEIPVDLYKVMLKGDSSQNVRLEDGDTINVPENQAKVGVLGWVTKPGAVIIPDGRDLTLTGALREAGGPISEAKIDAITLSRKDETGNYVARSYNLKTITAGKKGIEDPILQDGDLLVVAQSGKANTAMIGGILGVIISIARFGF